MEWGNDFEKQITMHWNHVEQDMSINYVNAMEWYVINWNPDDTHFDDRVDAMESYGESRWHTYFKS